MFGTENRLDPLTSPALLLFGWGDWPAPRASIPLRLLLVDLLTSFALLWQRQRRWRQLAPSAPPLQPLLRFLVLFSPMHGLPGTLPQKPGLCAAHCHN